MCITDAQSLDRLSLQSQEELEEVNLERYLQVVSPVILLLLHHHAIITSMIITITTRVRAVQQVGRRTLTLCSQIPPVFRGSQTSSSRSSGSDLCFGSGIVVVVLRFLLSYNFAATKTLCSGRLASAIGIWRKVRVLRSSTWPGCSFRLFLLVFKIPSSRLC